MPVPASQSAVVAGTSGGNAHGNGNDGIGRARLDTGALTSFLDALAALMRASLAPAHDSARGEAGVLGANALEEVVAALGGDLDAGSGTAAAGGGEGGGRVRGASDASAASAGVWTDEGASAYLATHGVPEGTAVEARYNGMSRFYPGSVTAVSMLADGFATHSIAYSDGDTETGVRIDLMRAPGALVWAHVVCTHIRGAHIRGACTDALVAPVTRAAPIACGRRHGVG